MDIRKDIYQRVKELRLSLGMTQEQLANKVFISQSAISAIESGDRSIKAEELPELAKAFGTSVEYLVTGRYPENVTTCEDLHLSNETIEFLREHRDHMGGLAIDALVKDWKILDRMFWYFYRDFNFLHFWEDDENGGYFRTIPVSEIADGLTTDSLSDVILLQIIDKLRKIREVCQDGKS